MGGGTVSVRNSPSGSAVDDGRDTALEKTTAVASEDPPEDRAPGVSWGFFLFYDVASVVAGLDEGFDHAEHSGNGLWQIDASGTCG